MSEPRVRGTFKVDPAEYDDTELGAIIREAFARDAMAVFWTNEAVQRRHKDTVARATKGYRA